MRTTRERGVGQAFRSAGTALIIALSGLGMLASLLGIVAIWRTKGPLEERGATGLMRLEAALVVAKTSLQVVNTNLDAIDEAQLANAGRTLAALPDIVVAVNTTLEAVNEIPFLSVPTIDQEQLRAIGERVNALSAAITAARQRNASGGGAPTDLEAVRAAAADLDRQVGTAQSRVAEVAANWPRWVDRVAFGLTALLGWLALAQAGLGRLAWTNWRHAR